MLKKMKMRLLSFLCMTAIMFSGKSYTAQATGNIASSTATVFTDTAPCGVQISTVNASSHKVSWEPLQDADGYYVYCSPKKGSGYSCIGITHKTSMYSRDLKIGTVYYYKVQAYKETNGEPCFSLISDVSAKAAGHPGMPSISNQQLKKQGKKIAVIRWSNISDAKYIQLYRKKAGQKYKKILDSKITKPIKNGVTVSYVKTSGEMKFKARTYNKSQDGVRFYSSFSQTKKIKLR